MTTTKVKHIKDMTEKKYCEYCGKLIGEAGKIYMAGTICIGHRLGLIEYLRFKILKFLKLWIVKKSYFRKLLTKNKYEKRNKSRRFIIISH